MTLKITVPRKGFSCDGHLVHLSRLWDCVAARLVDDDQFEVARHEQRYRSVA